MSDAFQPSDSPPTNVAEFSVSQISGAIKRTMEDAFGRVRVRGELGRVSRPASGHIYLDLKDDRSVLSGVIWKGAAAKMPVRPEEGLEVIATGRITTFPGQSKYQMVIDALEPAGEGALMALLEERKRKLAAEGLFAAERKKPLPYMPRVIGVVTSPTGAVIRDILHRLNDRFPVHVVVWPVRVQGETSAQEVARAIHGFNTLDGTEMVPRPDLLIVARGGGSIEDLWGFNEEIVARAAAASAIPLISAVGHETDTTLIDYVADQRAPTPTGAAEMAVPVRADLVAHLANVAARLHHGGTQAIARKRERHMALSRLLPQPDRLLELPRQRFDAAEQRLGRALGANLDVHWSKLMRAAALLQPARLETRLMVGRNDLRRAGAALPASLGRLAKLARRDLTTLGARLSPVPLERRTVQARQGLMRATTALDDAQARRLERANAALERSRRLLDTLSYRSVLARGFALVRDADGKPVRQTGPLKTGDLLSIEFAGDDRVDVMVSGGGVRRPKAAASAVKDNGEQESLL